MTSERISNLVNAVDWIRGYRVGPNSIAVVYVSDAGTSGPLASITFDGQIDAEPAEAAASMVRENMVPPVEGYPSVVVLRREADPETSDAFFDEFNWRLSRQTEPVTPRMNVCVTPDQEMFVREPTPGSSWQARGTVGEPDPTLALSGYMAPAATEEEFVGRFSPTAKPTFRVLGRDNPARKFLESSSPHEQMGVITNCLDRLATVRGAAIEDQQRWKQWVAHLATHSLLMRDVTLCHAARSDMGTEALVQVAREAPEKYRPHVAAAAGAAIVVRGLGTRRADALFDHANVNGEELSLARLMRRFARSGIPPEEARLETTEFVTEVVNDAQRDWEKEHRPAPPDPPIPDVDPGRDFGFSEGPEID